MKQFFKSRKIGCGLLMLLMGGVAISQSFSCIKNESNLYSGNSGFSVINNDCLEAHCRTNGQDKNILITKDAPNDEYQYTISDCNTSEPIYTFKSSKEISLQEEKVKNETMCTAVYAFVDALNKNHGNVDLALRALCEGGGTIATIAANPAFRAAVALIAEGTPVTAVLSVLTGWEVFVIGGGIATIA